MGRLNKLSHIQSTMPYTTIWNSGGTISHFVGQVSSEEFAETRNALFIPVVFQNARVLAALVHPSHLVCLSSWGFSRLPPTCISKSIGYSNAAFDHHRYSILDLRKSLVEQISAKEIECLAAVDAAATYSVPHKNIVFVVDNPDTIRFAELYINDSRLMGSSWHYKICRDLDLALAWGEQPR